MASQAKIDMHPVASWAEQASAYRTYIETLPKQALCDLGKAYSALQTAKRQYFELQSDFITKRVADSMMPRNAPERVELASATEEWHSQLKAYGVVHEDALHAYFAGSLDGHVH